MSTETTNKKIKIDNGTTFGRTYTDKAVDELLKNAGSGGTSVIELTDKNGTIASTQLGEINANPQNFSFKYNGKILLFTSADSTTYQYCNNTTSSSENNVMTTSTLLTITSSTGTYTVAENVHNVVANSIHPANGGNLTNIQVGSKVYSIPSGGGGNITGEALINATKDTTTITRTLDTDGKVKFDAKGIYEYRSNIFSFDFKVPAGNYVLGNLITINSRVQIEHGYVIGVAYGGYYTTCPSPEQERIPTEPIWEIETLPNGDGSLHIGAKCIKEGTLSALKNYSTKFTKFVYLFDVNYR